MHPPLVGLTLDDSQDTSFSRYPWYALRKNYCSAITQAGGAPVTLPFDRSNASTYTRHLSGLVITGGNFDVDPKLFGQPVTSHHVTVKNERTDFELTIIKRALALNMPVLGICGGMQLLNVACGGTLIQHIPDAVPHALAHEQPNPRHEVGHSITITPNTRLADIVGAKTVDVNSAHHQAVDQAAPSLQVNAHAPDGVIEGIESRSPDTFCLGVQWHPEFLITSADHKIFKAFIDACHVYAGRKHDR